jgi:hypothetical protein
MIFMQKVAYKAVFDCLLKVLPFVILVSCVHTPNITGKWLEPGTTSSIELRHDGTFTVIDIMGMQVSGHYTLHSYEKIQFEINSSDSVIETIKGSLTVQGDELILSFDEGKEVLKYKKIQ